MSLKFEMTLDLDMHNIYFDAEQAIPYIKCISLHIHMYWHFCTTVLTRYYTLEKSKANSALNRPGNLSNIKRTLI